MGDGSTVQYSPGIPAPEHARDRTFRITVKTAVGTAFIVHHEDRPFLVTANHVLTTMTDPSEIVLEGHLGRINVELTELARAPQNVDAAVFSMSDDPLPAVQPLTIAVRTAPWSHPAFFLGYPFSFGQLTNTPFVKGARFSGSLHFDTGDTLWLLDGMSNPGFSGGPVIYHDVEDGLWHVAAVVQGFERHYLPVEVATADADQKLKAAVGTNPGLFRAWDLRPVMVAALEAAVLV